MICNVCGRRFPNQFNIQTCRVCARLADTVQVIEILKHIKIPKQLCRIEKKSLDAKCNACGIEFQRLPWGKGRPQLFCSRECQQSVWIDKRRKQPKPCLGCGKLFVGRKTCSKTCQEAIKERRKERFFGPPRICDNCNRQFTYNEEAYMNYCSRKCRKEGRFKNKKLNSHVRRARQAGVTIEKFKAEDVFLRDGYRCKHCKKKTRPDLKPPHPLYPNLDHIIPLSKGGEHSMKNTQCLCASCNSKKSNKDSGEQMLLFG